ncbi:MAG: sugar ABC transporter permease [Anaerolineales bacterium]|nr:sugar ABC transporter permease [Anaerolineales bacterium]
MKLSSEFSKQIRQNIQSYMIILALVGIWITFAFMTEGRFLSAQNFSNLFRQMTVTAFMAVGMVLVIVTGNIDLSVGKLAGFVSVVVAHFQARVWTQLIPGQTLLAATLSIFIGLAVGALVGVIQGWIISYLKVPSFIVTLGGMFVFNGGILIITQGKTIPANQPYLQEIAQGYLPNNVGWIIAIIVIALLFWQMFSSRRSKRQYGFELKPFVFDLITTILFSLALVVYIFMVNEYRGIQAPVLLLAVTALIMSYVSNNTRFGRYAYAIGGNKEAARLSGINIKNNVFLIFVLMGFLCGVAGIVLASYVGYGTTAAGQGYELDAIASAILGGTSTLGGEGTIVGALIGALIMSSLSNGLQIMNVQASWQYIVKGAVLVLAVYADVTLKKRK